jgi:hypothetical protein
MHYSGGFCKDVINQFANDDGIGVLSVHVETNCIARSFTNEFLSPDFDLCDTVGQCLSGD